MNPRSWSLPPALFCLVASLSACGGSPALRAARSGNHQDLKAAIARDRAEGRLDRGRVRDIALAVGAREIRTAGPPDAASLIDEARACTRPLAGPLEERARTSDDAGASAALALIDGHSGWDDGDDLLRRYGTAESPLWRAVAARAALGKNLGPARRKFFVDPDERVRLAALRAALELADPADQRPLLEAARLDPNPVAQAIATRALGAFASAEVVFGLRDLYTRADDGLRQSIVDAWGQAPSASAGGLGEIIRVAENERGAPGIEAGWVLLRFKAEHDAAAIGTRTLIRGMKEGISRDRVLAIMDAPTEDPAVLDALRKAASLGDPAVKSAALSRLAEMPGTRAQALLDLRELAKSGSQAAVLALARANDADAIETLRKSLASSEKSARLSAMRALVGMGKTASAAELLADGDPHVRMSVSCAILAVPD
jgi:HEAT repeat protein